jgi:hypothetical protein
MIHAFAQLGLAPKLDDFFAACRGEFKDYSNTARTERRVR